jgi:hypothetical protein
MRSMGSSPRQTRDVQDFVEASGEIRGTISGESERGSLRV